MAPVAIHLGLHKTASGTMQRQLFPACEELNLLTSLTPQVRQFVFSVARKDPMHFDAAAARELLSGCWASDKLNLISNESLSGPPYSGLAEFGLDHRSPILTNLGAAYPEARVFVVLRRQDKLAKSLYRQYLKVGGTKKIQRFYGVDNRQEPGLMATDRFCFSPWLAALDAQFPAGVLLLTFEEFVADRPSFLSKLSTFLEVTIPDMELVSENATTLGPFGLEATRVLNHLFRNLANPGGMLPGPKVNTKTGRGRKSPVELIHDFYPSALGANKKTGIIDTVSEALFDRVRADNQLLDERYALDLKRWGYY